MESSGSGSRLIIVCGLPGSGKTTHARSLESGLGAIRFCPDGWMSALALDLFDEPRRAKIEALQRGLTRQLLSHGLTVSSIRPPRRKPESPRDKLRYPFPPHQSLQGRKRSLNHVTIV